MNTFAIFVRHRRYFHQWKPSLKQYPCGGLQSRFKSNADQFSIFLSLLLYPKRKLKHEGELTFYKCAQKLRGSYLKSKSIKETRQVCLKKNYNYVTLTIHFQNQSNKSNEMKNVKKLFLNFEISYLSKILGSFGWKMRPNTFTIQALY